jgi:hypothetical protein
MRAERVGKRHFPDSNSRKGLEPLAARVHETKCGDWGPHEQLGDVDNLIKLFFLRGVQDIETKQRFQPSTFSSGRRLQHENVSKPVLFDVTIPMRKSGFVCALATETLRDALLLLRYVDTQDKY